MGTRNKTTAREEGILQKPIQIDSFSINCIIKLAPMYRRWGFLCVKSVNLC